MRAWHVRASDPAPRLVLESTERQPLSDDHVVMRVRAVALNHRDLLVVGGRVNAVPDGRVPCSDASGEIVEAGAAVDGVRPGDRVVTVFAPRWIDGSYTRDAAMSVLGGVHVDGVLADEVVLPACAVIRVPDALSHDQACTLPCAGLTAWHALFEESPLPPRAQVLTIGAGGVSVFALQLAHRAGCRVLATSRDARKLERLARLGADVTIDTTATPAWGERAHGLSRDGVDHVIEVGGQGTLAQSIRATRHGGTISLIGTLARPTPVDLTPVLMRNIRIQGIVAGSREMFTRMLATLGSGSIQPVIDRVFDFADVPAAFEYFARGAHVGKIVVRL